MQHHNTKKETII